MRNSLIIILMTLFGCHYNQKTKLEDKDDSSNNLNPIIKCYQASVKKDSAFIKLVFAGDSLSGQLNYKFYEKDNTKGVVKGTIVNDTLIMRYDFMSEGANSVSTIKMLLRDNKLYEIYGNKTAKASQGFIYVEKDCD